MDRRQFAYAAAVSVSATACYAHDSGDPLRVAVIGHTGAGTMATVLIPFGCDSMRQTLSRLQIQTKADVAKNLPNSGSTRPPDLRTIVKCLAKSNPTSLPSVHGMRINTAT